MEIVDVNIINCLRLVFMQKCYLFNSSTCNSKCDKTCEIGE